MTSAHLSPRDAALALLVVFIWGTNFVVVRWGLDMLPPLQPNQLFELTLEPPTGSPIGKPTGPIQFIGRAVKVL